MDDLLDTHCHMQSAGLAEGERSTRELWAKAPDITGAEIVARAHAAGVSRMLCVGCDLEDSELAISFVADQPNCYATIGLHPHEAQHYFDQPDRLAQFAALATSPKVVAVGECGLDYFYEHSPREAQLATLRFQIELAQKHDLPMIFHVREAFDDFWPVFSERYAYKPIRGVLHSFTDSMQNLQKATEYGLFIGVNGIATFAKQPAQLEVYKAIPLNKLLLETDAPFLTPAPYRGKVNESKHLPIIANFLSALRGEDIEVLARATTANGRELFLI
ncbi:MAG: sec-independent protein translocase protein [Candidatus Saccharibacteria bacterium]|nr:sec-independent protein translocase protein [Candidatus Saccharibacteria bacterium]